MNPTKIIPVLLFTIIVSLFIAQELRFRRAIAELRAEIAAAQATANSAANISSPAAEELHEAVRQLSQARSELASAQHRLSMLADASAQLQGRSNSLGPRRRFISTPIPTAEIETESNQPADSSEPRRRAWGEEQATGPADTFAAGDISTAWASREPDGGEEWLHLTYSNTVQLAEVRVRETYNPGAISKVVAVLPGGAEVPIWEGVDEPGVAPIDKVFRVNGAVAASEVKIYLDTRRVAGWNEIDAVELVGRDGSRQWASHARASSSYAERR